jgi:tRNA dimethylallyltransferase
LAEAIDRIKTGTRHLAKRQITWFKKTEGLIWMKTSVLNTWAMLKILVDALNVKD